MSVIDDVKTLLGICDTDSDKKLNLIIRNTEKQVLSYLPEGLTEVPGELDYVVCEMAVVRFNRIGNEGMTSYSQEGESITYGDDITPYLAAIQAWVDARKEIKKGVVRFL